MSKLHELLAAEKTPTGAWNALYEDTLKKFKNVSHFFDGHSKSLAMIAESPESKAIEAQAREEKPVTTTVYETLEYALDIYGKSEDLQFQKNATNRKASGTVMWQGQPLLMDMPVDELLGLEARLTRLRQLFAEIPHARRDEALAACGQHRRARLGNEVPGRNDQDREAAHPDHAEGSDEGTPGPSAGGSEGCGHRYVHHDQAKRCRHGLAEGRSAQANRRIAR